VSWPASPPWLLELQARFGSLLRTPLDRASGSLRALTSEYDGKLVAAALPSPTLSSAERLAVYHRQYWFRLFTVMQRQYPLTARLLGYWRFNDYAARHLAQRPPRGLDIDALGDGFAEFVASELAETAPAAAAHVDAAFHRVARAPRTEPLRLGPADAARLSGSCLALSPSVAILEERWALCELRAKLLEQAGESAATLAEPLPEPRHWLLTRNGTTLGVLALAPREAELLRLLQQYPLEPALARLESTTPESERAQLPERAQAWLARSMRLGIWAGFRDA